MEEHIIHIAYDRKNGTYVGYNVEDNIFAVGICVESACDQFRAKYYENAALLAAEDYAEQLKGVLRS